MGHIERRPDRPKPWRARTRGPDGRERSRSFARKVDAQRWLAEIEAAKVQGTWTDPAHGRVRLHAWVGECQRTSNLRPTTKVRDASLLRTHILPRFGQMPLGAIHHRDVRTWVADLTDAKLAPATVHKAYQTLAKYLAAAVDAGMIARNPCHRIPLPKVERDEMRFLTHAEVDRLANAIHPSYRALVLLGAYGGLRIGELAGLRRRAVDLPGRTIEVVEVLTEPGGRPHLGPPKTRAGRRRINLPGFVADALAEHLPATGPTTAFVFAAPRGGLFRPTNFRRDAWPQATAAADLSGLRVHDLRHTAVALWIAAGANPKQVSVRAGHTSVAFTLDRYGHLYPESDIALCDRLDELHQAAQHGRRGPDAAQPGR